MHLCTSPGADDAVCAMQATTYMQLVGILLGQFIFGFMGDWLGRRTAMLIDMAIILIGVIMLTVANGTSEQARPAVTELTSSSVAAGRLLS